MTRLTLIAALAGTFLATAAFAVTEADTDGDGMATYEELLVVAPDLTEDGFALIDLNGDGMVDAEEYAGAQEGGMIPADS